MTDVSDIIERLRNVAEDLGDMAMTLLSEAIASGSSERPATEKSISQAKRTVEKAVFQLEKVEPSTD